LFEKITGPCPEPRKLRSLSAHDRDILAKPHKYPDAMKNRYYFSLFVFILLIKSINLTAQPAHLSLSDTLACPDTDITITLYAEDLYNVGAISLYIGYDTTVIQYAGHGNTNPQFPGIMTNAVVAPATQVNIAWSSLNPGNLSSGILLELYFEYIDDACPVTFNPGGDITSVNLMPIPFTTSDGSAGLAPPYLIEDPENAVVTAGNDATFSITATEVSTYQWQESDGSGWYDLQNNATYQNVNGPELTITGPAIEMDSLFYRCFISAENACEVYSDSAMLTVLPELTALLTLSSVASCPFQQVLVPMKGYALDDVIEFAFYIAYQPEITEFVGLANVNPAIEGAATSLHTAPVPHIKIFWSAAVGINIPDGTLFDLVFNYAQGSASLVFMDDSFVLSAGMFNYNLSTINGQVNTLPFPVITSQPADTTVLAGTIAQFTVEANNTTNYHWYESQDNGSSWAPLQNIAPYAGVLTETLSIGPVTASLYDYLYKCKVSNTDCETFSDSALLQVDTLTAIHRINHTGELSINGHQNNQGSITLTLNTPVSGSIIINLYALNGSTFHQEVLNASLPGQQHLIINKSPGNTGILLVQCVLLGDDKKTYKTSRKILTSVY
jgi:hypothetical protein